MRRGGVVLGLALVACVGLMSAVAIAWRRHAALVETEHRLAALVPRLRQLEADGKLAHALDPLNGISYGGMLKLNPFEVYALAMVQRGDGWGRSFVLRLPGVVHTHGWDLYSVGPNGIDENGQGDDILVGEDVAVFWSGS